MRSNFAIQYLRYKFTHIAGYPIDRITDRLTQKIA
jgi:hypothetical protein